MKNLYNILLCNKKGISKVFLLICVFLLGAIHFSQIYKSNYFNGQFYQSWFGPAAKMACGQGYTNYDQGAIGSEKLYSFLNNIKKDNPNSISCEDVLKAPVTPLNYYQYSKYLIGAVGLIWKVKGVEWQSLYILVALLGGLSWLFFTLLLSKFLGFWLGSFLTPIFMYFSIINNYAIHIRDFSKVPFFLFFIYLLLSLIMELLCLKRLKTLVLISAAIGLTLGLSIGFRGDLKLMWLPYVLVCTLCLFPFSRKSLFKTFVLVSVAIIMYLLAGLPMLFNDNQSYAQGHVAVLGFADKMDDILGLASDDYSKVGAYKDWNVIQRIQTYNSRFLKLENVELGQLNFGRAGKSLFIEWVKNFPFDFYWRSLTTSVRIFDLTLKTQGYFFNFIYLLSIAGVVFIFFIISSFSIFRFVVLFLVWVFFFTYPSLQFQQRHFFQMEPLLVVLAIFSLFISFNLFYDHNYLKSFKPRKANILLICSLFFLVPNFLYYLQRENLIFISEELAKMNEGEEISFNNVNDKINTNISFDLNKLKPGYYFLKLKFDKSKRCNFYGNKVSFKYRYSQSHYGFNFEKSFNAIPNGRSFNFIFIPTVISKESRLKQIVFEGSNNMKCLEKVSLLNDPQFLKPLPLLFVTKNINNQLFSYKVPFLFRLSGSM